MAAVMGLACLLGWIAGSRPALAAAAPATVNATVETAAVPHADDAADDAALWVDERRPSQSIVIGTDKQGGLAVYDLAGRQLRFYADSEPNNVDLRYGFPLRGSRVALVATSDRVTDAIRLYVVDPRTRSLRYAARRTLETGIGVSGLCMYRSRTGAYYVFVGDSSGTVQQWRLETSGNAVDARKVRTLRHDSSTEGCVADDALGRLYVGEEDVGVWRYGAEPGAGSSRRLVDAVQGGRIVADVEGLALYELAAGSGYLIVSSQGSDSFTIYDRKTNAYVGSFRIGAGPIDEVTHTDGVEATSRSLGPAFPRGAFVAQDDRNDGGNQNFKLVPWERIARPLRLSERRKPATTRSPSSRGAPRSYFVDSRTGNDRRSGTSAATAWRTLARTASAPLRPGDRLLLARAASWREQLVVRASGTPERPVVIGSYGHGPAPVVERATACVVVHGSFVTIRGLHVRDCDWAGLEISGSGDRVEASTVERNAAGVYVRRQARGTMIGGNRIHDNARMSVLTRRPDDDDSGAFGILVHGDLTEIASNVIAGSDAFSFDYGRDGAAVEVYGARGTYVHHNVAIDNDAFVEIGNRAVDTRVVYNVVRSSLSTSVFLVTRGAGSRHGPVLRTALYHNSVSLAGASSQGVVCHDGCGPEILRMRNNVVSAATAGFADGAFDEDFDLFGSPPRFATGPHTIVADPSFRDRRDDLRLRSDSRAVDRGVGGLAYRSDADRRAVPADGDGDGVARPDIGAYELSGPG